MKINKYCAAFYCAVLVLTGCIEENFEAIKGKSGDDIVFGVVAGFEDNTPETKTVYTGDHYYVTSNGVVSNQKPTSGSYRRFEYVNWVKNDKVLINCDQGNQTAHYIVTGNSSSEGLERMTLEGENHNGIQWQDMSKPHTFYAIYPSPYQFDKPDNVDHVMLNRYKDRIKVVGSNLHCYLPVSQTPKSMSCPDGKNWVAEPNMDLAYMIAKTTVSAENNGGGVALNFRPIVTALEVTLSFPTTPEGGISPDDGDAGTTDSFNGWSAVSLSNVQIMSTDGSPITGSFSLDLEEYVHQENVEYPEVTFTDISGEDLDAISVQLWDSNGQAIVVNAEGSLKFTVFLRPKDINLDKLAIRLNMNGVFKTAQIGKSLAVNGTPLVVEAHKKQYITGITLPANPIVNNEEIIASGSNWVSQLDPATYMEGLSIPGTANSFSYNYGRESSDLSQNAISINNNYMTQTLSFENQWSLGVRCFELVSDRCGNNSSAGEDNGTGNLGNQNLRCNNQSLGLTVKDAYDKIIEKVLATPGEFAMIIMTYQPRGGGNAARNPEYYMDVLKNFYKNYSYNNIKLSDISCIYKPGLRVADIQQTPIMIVARPSQEGEDTNIDSAIAGPEYNILTVKGWGSLPDKWYKRGYDAKLYQGLGGSAGNQLYSDTSHPDLPAMEDWIYGTPEFHNYIIYQYYTLDGDRRTDSRPSKGTARFEYDSDQGYAVWAQEWRRVHTDAEHVTDRYKTTTSNDQWLVSDNEKKSDILDCLTRSISKEKNRVYFNSLDGFYITTQQNSYDHYWRGNEGNIGQFATDINTWFYPVLQQYSAADVTGPLGVIILDRVTMDGGAGQLLPQTIIQNNFMFNVPKDPNYNPGQ